MKNDEEVETSSLKNQNEITRVRYQPLSLERVATDTTLFLFARMTSFLSEKDPDIVSQPFGADE